MNNYIIVNKSYLYNYSYKITRIENKKYKNNILYDKNKPQIKIKKNIIK